MSTPPDDANLAASNYEIPYWLMSYGISGTLVGIFVFGLGFWAAAMALDACSDFAFEPVPPDPWAVPIAPSALYLPPLKEVINTIFPAMAIGFVCGWFLLLIRVFWPAIKHPVRAASMSASLAGSLVLIYFSRALPINVTGIFWKAGIVLACVTASFAIWGFLTTIVVQTLRRRFRRSRAS